MLVRGIAATAFLGIVMTPLEGQWVNVPPLKIPRTATGEPDMKAPAPRRPDGKPDLTGSWSPNDNRYGRDFASGMKPEDIPFQPWARALFEQRKDGSHSREDPDANCLPQGVPKISSISYPWKVIETPNSVAILYEAFTLWRQIFTDGRDVDPDANPTWMGYSVGRWEGDDFVVHTRGFNGKAWLDQLGRPTTDRLRVIERFRRIDYGHMMIDITIDDPGAYTKPFSVTQEMHLRPGWEPLEFICNENNKDLEHLPGRADVF
jgi:hypothetical protein